MTDKGMAIRSDEQYNALINRNVIECDEIISKLIRQIAEKNALFFHDEMINSLSALMTARAAYAENVYRENVTFVESQINLLTRGEEWKSGQ